MGAKGLITYALLPHLCSGQTWGPDQPMNIQLHSKADLRILGSVKMELEDCIHPLVRDIEATIDLTEATRNADVIIAIEDAPKPGVELKDMIEQNASFMRELAESTAANAAPGVKLLMVGENSNTNCLVFSECAVDIPRKSVTGLSRLQYNRGVSQLATKTAEPCNTICNLCVWGKVGKTELPDARTCTISGTPAKEAVGDEQWTDNTFAANVTERGAALVQMECTGALSTAQAISDHLHDWMVGTPPGRHVPMSVDSSENSYGITPGLFFSLPVTCSRGEWTIVNGLATDDAVREKLMITENDLLDEKNIALEFLTSAPKPQ
eukprot:CAMPEP_0173456862 /NCGR_PEP_ID=MMETSP1357-20121228/56697_1 /TAXON_ID=77926 /ORGANISM="Hemiselmis rufescens, Strain PCC563" /LENGTH=322 /DNA_ID=CAMNT_0014424113 /DNA_START=17 /DNA_END=985 /DNA_ORIENTATION=-